MGGRGSTRWGRRWHPPHVRLDEALTLTSCEAARSLCDGALTGLGAIRWSSHPAATMWARRRVVVRQGTLVMHETLRVLVPE